MTVAEYKKIWSWKDYGDGAIIITKYKGNDSRVVVPEIIEKNVVKAIGWGALDNCSDVYEIVLPESIVEIEDFAFSKTSISSIKCPDNIERLGAVFPDCVNLKEVIFPKKLKILDRTFMRSGIENVVIPEGVEEISCAFMDCEKLKSISLPSTLKNIHVQTFNNCNSIEKITVAENVACRYENGYLYTCESMSEGNANYENMIIVKEKSSSKVPEGTTTFSRSFVSGTDIVEYEIPEGVQVIGFCAFENCTKLEKVIIPNTVTTIEHDAFRFCTSLKEVSLPSSVTKIESGAFAYCTSLEKVVFMSKSTEIEYACFYGCSSLREIILPENLQEITSKMFGECTSLEKVNIPASVKSIGREAFYYCTVLEEIILHEGLEIIEEKAFAHTYKLKEIIIPASVKKIEKDMIDTSGVESIKCKLPKAPKGWSTQFARYFLNPICWGYEE